MTNASERSHWWTDRAADFIMKMFTSNQAQLWHRQFNLLKMCMTKEWNSMVILVTGQLMRMVWFVGDINIKHVLHGVVV